MKVIPWNKNYEEIIMKTYLKITSIALLTCLSIANKAMTFEVAKGVRVTVNGPIKETTTIDKNGNTIKAWADESGNVYTKPVEAFAQKRSGHRTPTVFHGGTHHFYNGKHYNMTSDKSDLVQRLSQCSEDIKNASWVHGSLAKACTTAFETLKEAEKVSDFESGQIIDWADRIIYTINMRLEEAKKGRYAANPKSVEKILYKITATYGSEICSNKCKLISNIMSQYGCKD
jgi:hypothetical protein